jgi:hypothetical protein
MEFSIEFYKSASGSCPVQEFLDELKKTDPDDFAMVLRGWPNYERGIIPGRPCQNR